MYKKSPKAKISLYSLSEVIIIDKDLMNTRDCLQRAWVNTMELVRDFEMYSKRIDDKDVSEVFKQYAEEQAMQASNFREIFKSYE